MQDYFNRISKTLDGLIQGDEIFTANFSAEDSDFVRFNKNQVRQAGHVVQRYISVDLIEGQKHVAGTVTLSGDFELDSARLKELVKDIRDKRQHVKEDPYLLYETKVSSGEVIGENKLLAGPDAVAAIRNSGKGRDLVGIYAQGGIYSGFANSLGQQNWYSNYSYNLDWSFYHKADKAVKAAYAGFEWNPAEFDRKVNWATEQLDVLVKPAKTITPGEYRVYLAPAALSDIIGILSWGAFGLKAQKTKQSPLLKMIEGEAALNPALGIAENTKEGVAPNFQEAGFLRPDRVPLIVEGRMGDCLISPRSAKEYGVQTNGASSGEAPESVDVTAGKLPADGVLKELDTGIFINNLWYLNYSDRSACRTTGMTRFATFWVENGKIQAPLNVMRFDETIYRMLGEKLVGLTSDREMILEAGTYGGRSTGSARLPGALVNDFTLTL